MPKRLIISVDVKGGAFFGFSVSWPGIYQVLRTYLGGQGDMRSYQDALSTGRPYHLPFSFEEDEALAFQQELEAAGCRVLLTAAA